MPLDGSGRLQVGDVVELKRHAQHALEKLWSFHQAFSEAEEAALRRVAVLLVTTGVALKIFGRAAAPGSPAAKLMRRKQSSALILDEMQRCPIETFCAWGSRPGVRKSTRRRQAAAMPPSPRRPLRNKRVRRLPPSRCWHGHRLRLAHRTAR